MSPDAIKNIQTDAGLDRWMRNRREWMSSFLCDLIAARTENPPGCEYRAARIVKKALSEFRIKSRIVEAAPGRANLIAKVGQGHPKILVACHLDTVPAGDGWRHDPFTARCSRGRVYGRGAADNKGQIPPVVALAGWLKAQKPRLKGTFIFVAAADEERGSTLGLAHLVEKGMLQADFAVVPDVGGQMRTLSIGEKGALFLKLTCSGRTAHGSTPRAGSNAILAMTDVLKLFGHLPFQKASHPLFSSPTLNVGMIHGGQAPNMVPGKCTAEIDIRYLPGQSKTGIMKEIRQACAKVSAKRKKVRFSLEVTSSMLPTVVKSGHPCIEALVEAAQEVLGTRPKITSMSGATICKQLIQKGIPSVGFAPGDMSNFHAPNEYIALSELVNFGRILGRFTGRMLF